MIKPGLPWLDGLTLSGGEPFAQAEALVPIAKFAKEQNLHVMTYTGYTWEELQAGFAANPSWKELLQYVDVLMDGRFILAQRTLDLPYRGSSNQRAIAVQQTLADNMVVLHTFDTF